MECRPYKDAYDLAGWFELRRPTFALIELVHARPGNGVSSMFKFGTNFGIWQGIIAAFKIPFSTITAAKWQRLIGMPTGSSKNDLALRAKSLYPKLAATITQKTADAVLICHVARHQARELRHGVVLD